MAEVKEYEIKVKTSEAQKAVEELNEQLKIQGDVVLELQGQLLNLEKELDKIEGNSGKAISQRKILNAQIKKTKAELKGETLAQKVLNKQKKDHTDVIKKNVSETKKAAIATKGATKETVNFSGALGFIDQKTGGAVTGFKNLVKGLVNVRKGFTGVKIAIISTGIGAFVVAVGSLAAAFTRSEKGQEKFQRIMAGVGAVVNQVMDAFADLGEALLKPEETLKKLANGFLEFAKKPLPFLIDGFKNAGKAASDFVEETSKELDIIDKITKKRQKAHHIERDLQVERANADREINEIRLKAEDRETQTASDRIKLLRKAQQIEEDITQKEINAKQLYLDALLKENDLGKSTIKDKDDIAKLQAELIDLDTKKLRAQRLLQTQATTAINEEKREKEQKIKDEEAQIAKDKKQKEDKIQEDKENEIQKAEDLAALKKEIRDKEAVSEDESRALRLIKIKEEYDLLIQLAKEAGLLTADLEAARDEAINEAKNAFNEKDIQRADKLVADKQKLIDKELQSEEKRKEDTITYRNETFDNAVMLAGAETKLGKALLLAKQLLLAKDFVMSLQASIKNATLATSDATVKGANAGVEVAGSVAKASNSAPFPLNLPFILGALATGIGIVSAVSSAVKATKTAANAAGGSGGGGGISSSGLSSIAASAPTSSAPSFNIVGQSGTNQLADAIGGQNQRPLRTYVVASDVTSAQSMERNIISGSSLGG